jgi:hypothetical protein
MSSSCPHFIFPTPPLQAVQTPIAGAAPACSAAVPRGETPRQHPTWPYTPPAAHTWGWGSPRRRTWRPSASRRDFNRQPGGGGSPRRRTWRPSASRRDFSRQPGGVGSPRRRTWRRVAPLAAISIARAVGRWLALISAEMVDSLRQLCYASQATQQHGEDRCEGRP